MSDYIAGEEIVKTDYIKGSCGELYFQTTKLEYDGPVGDPIILGDNLYYQTLVVNTTANPLSGANFLQRDESFAHFSHIDGAGIKLMAGGKIRMEAPYDLSINVNNNSFDTVLGDKQVFVGRDINQYFKGDFQAKLGSQTPIELAACIALQEEHRKVQNAGIAAAINCYQEESEQPIDGKPTFTPGGNEPLPRSGVPGEGNKNIPAGLGVSEDCIQEFTVAAGPILPKVPPDLPSCVSLKYPCPVCNQNALYDSQSLETIKNVKLSEKLNQIPYIGPWFARIYNSLRNYIPTSQLYKQLNFDSESTCGSPSCKHHMVLSLSGPIKALNRERVSFHSKDSWQEKISQLEAEWGGGGQTLVNVKKSCMINVGTGEDLTTSYLNLGYHVYPTGFRSGSNGGPMIFSSKGCPKKIIHIPYPQNTEGILTLKSSSTINIHSGAGGISSITHGPVETIAGSLEMRANEGEAIFGSDNLTTICGQGVQIVADDKTNYGSIVLDSPTTLVTKALSVGADLAVKGGISIDGPLSVPYINVPGVGQKVTSSKPSQMTTGIEHQFPISQRLRYNSLDKDLGDNGKMNFDGWSCREDNLNSLVQELNDKASISDSTTNINAAGYCPVTTQVRIPMQTIKEYAVKALAQTYVNNPTDDQIYGGQLNTQLNYLVEILIYIFNELLPDELPGRGWGDGVWNEPTLCPVFTHHHSHSMFSMEHSGEVTVPMGNYFMTNEGVNLVRQVANSVPTPPPGVSAMGSGPGPNTLPHELFQKQS